MSLPKYDKSKRKKSFETLPKGAYVIKIMDAKQEPNRSGNGSHLTISFDIAEGEFKDFYANQYFANTNEDKKWNRDAVHYLTVPDGNCKQYVWDNWNTFFADLEDSNNGFVWDFNDFKALKGKLIGGKFAIEQSEWNGNIYDHTKFRWSCVADDVRNGRAGKMPNDKMVTSSAPSGSIVPDDEETEWMKVDSIEEELPFT